MLLMSSIIVTVLPTPAPPKSPTLPPLANGHMRSMTLMPVSSSSCDGESSSNAGALRWIDKVFFASTGPFSSIGRPSTSMMRPSVFAPTGTEIGAPVLTTFMPRRSPSEEPERDRPHDAVAQLLLDLERQPDLVHLERVVDVGQLVARELDVDDGADALNDRSLIHGVLGVPLCIVNSGPGGFCLRQTPRPPTISDPVT